MIFAWNLDQYLKMTRETAMSKNLMMTSSKQTVMSLSFFQFMSSLEQSESWILYALSIKLTFSFRVTFYLTKTENRTKTSLTQPSYYCFESIGTIFTQKYWFFAKKSADISKIKGTLVLYFLKLHTCVLMYQMSCF